MKKLLILSFLVATILTTKAQNADCKVSVDSLKGTYEGGCKNGKAEGQGKAAGTDSYDGEFRNGLPEGMGKYTWKNGNYYYGGWRKGLKEGKGQLHGFEDGKEKLVTGFWKKDKYIGENEQPYKILSATTDIGRVDVRNMSKKGSSINVTVKDGSDKTVRDMMDGSTLSASSSITIMSNFQVIRGSYTTKSNTRLANSDVTTFRDVTFPFTATFNFGNSILQIEIYEEGEWDIYVPINK